MRNFKKIFAGCTVLLALSATAMTAFAAAAYQTPADAAAGVTGKTVEEVIYERQTGTSYGAIAAEAGKLEEFQQSVLNIHRDSLQERVRDGSLTQAQADAAIAAMEQRQAICATTGTGYGAGCGMGAGYGGGYGYGCGMGRGMGRGMRNGVCPY